MNVVATEPVLPHRAGPVALPRLLVQSDVHGGLANVSQSVGRGAHTRAMAGAGMAMGSDKKQWQRRVLSGEGVLEVVARCHC